MIGRILFSLLVLGLVGCQSKGTQARPRVVIQTSLGNITAVIESERAPLTSRQFLKNVDNGVYGGGRATFYRVVREDNQPTDMVKIDVIQGGVDRETGDLATDYMPHEPTRDTRLRHRKGTLSMAREAPGTANTEFFICVEDEPELDFGGRRNPDGEGFAAFGRVTSGMSVVRRIQQQRDEGQYLVEPVQILAIDRTFARGAF